MSLFITIVVVSTALACALVGGIFFAFSNFVMQALARLPAAAGILAMQSINTVVLNKGFLGVFVGTALLALLLAGYSIANWSSPYAPWLLGGSFAYVFGCWLVTIAGNVPLNNRLASLLPDDPHAEEFWQHYLDRWMALNSQRAMGAMLAAALLIIGLLYANGSPASPSSIGV